MTPETRNAGKWARRIGFVVFVYGGLLLLSFLYFLPNFPKTRTQWLLFLIFGPLLYLLGEWIFGVLPRKLRRRDSSNFKESK